MSPDDAARIAGAMAGRLAHRGPDDSGQWSDGAIPVALGHRRLSIFDLSAKGHQPMASPNGRYVVAFNGAIYNFKSLRGALEAAGFAFASETDTEVLLAAFEHWGIDGAVPRLSGMFAIAAWDRHERCLTLIRDRAGKKPLYFGTVGKTFGFASELKSFLELPGFERRIDPIALSHYTRHACVPAPRSIYRGIGKLQPGHLARVSLRDGEVRVETAAYWRRDDFKPTAALDYKSAVSHAESLLKAAVAERMIADVPLGVFLSGGYDSTAVTALMQEQSPRAIQTFTIGFSDPAYDESAPAAAVARHLGTAHTEVRLDAEAALAVVEHLPDIYDEPFADASQIPTVLVARAARPRITVALSGDGGDEVFGGYNRHRLAPRLWPTVRSVPGALRAGMAAALETVPAGAWTGIERFVSTQLADKVRKLANALPATTLDDLYDRLVACWTQPPVAAQCPREAPSSAGRFDAADQMMVRDFLEYLPDDILVKVDRATMAVALEARAPLLDHRLVEFMGTLPSAYKIGGGTSKRILRDIVHARVPRSMMERPKAGFDAPIAAWLRGPLKAWADDLLSPAALVSSGLLDPAPIRLAWDQHRSGRSDRQHELWCVLMLQSWMRRYNATA
jgi:asparagine synthase (glutamine-hydrolysing)